MTLILFPTTLSDFWGHDGSRSFISNQKSYSYFIYLRRRWSYSTGVLYPGTGQSGSSCCPCLVDEGVRGGTETIAYVPHHPFMLTGLTLSVLRRGSCPRSSQNIRACILTYIFSGLPSLKAHPSVSPLLSIRYARTHRDS